MVLPLFWLDSLALAAILSVVPRSALMRPAIDSESLNSADPTSRAWDAKPFADCQFQQTEPVNYWNRTLSCRQHYMECAYLQLLCAQVQLDELLQRGWHHPASCSCSSPVFAQVRLDERLQPGWH